MSYTVVYMSDLGARRLRGRFPVLILCPGGFQGSASLGMLLGDFHTFSEFLLHPIPQGTAFSAEQRQQGMALTMQSLVGHLISGCPLFKQRNLYLTE